MSGPVRGWGTVALLVVLHFLLHVGLGIGEAAPDLLTVALLVAARAVPPGAGAGLGFVFGLLEDAFSVLAFGANTVAMTVVGAGGAVTRDLFVGDSLLFVVSYLFLGKWVRDLIFWGVVGEAVREPFVDAMVVGAALSALYVSAVGLVAFAASGAWGESVG